MVLIAGAPADHRTDRLMEPNPHAPASADPATWAWRRKTMTVFAGIIVGGFILIGGAVVLHHRSSSEADTLARTGARANGTVERVGLGSKGTEFLHLTYPGADGRWAQATIRVGSGRTYRPGDRVTVEYDPANPDRVRTDQESNAPGGRVALTLMATALGVSFAVILLVVVPFYLPFLRDLRDGAVWMPAVTTSGPDSLTKVVLPPGLDGQPGPVLRLSARTRIVAGTPVQYLARGTAPTESRRTALLRVPTEMGRTRPRLLLVTRQG